jgi:NADH-quinone oxidoreductase subunit G
MIVRTKSDKAIHAQKSVMEFLLINHPLDCPICDQGGECQLQDLAVGYGASSTRYEEEKRVVKPKDVSPLISMQEMTRCIHCTRCVRFGQEIAGVMELGMVHRGEHAEITTVKDDTIDSELSGNMIDICPVGALTSKPFRYSARTWELSRRKSVSPHDSTGANLIVHVKNHKVMRVLPFENDDVNECWIADRDRFSYEALDSAERLTKPMLKQGGQWVEVDWQTALEYIANGVQCITKENGAGALGALVSPHSTVEELYLAGALMRGLGSPNLDYRLRHADLRKPQGVRWLGRSVASLSQLQSVLVVGSNLRKDHPLFAQRIRQAARKGCTVLSIDNAVRDWAMPVAQTLVANHGAWLQALADVAAALAQEKGVSAPVAQGRADEPTARAIAQALLRGEHKAVLLGNAAAHHAQASELLALAGWIAQQADATVGFLTEAANTVGAQWMQALPGEGGMDAAQMLQGKLKGLFLLNNEPEFDSAAGAQAVAALGKVEMVVTLSPFKTNLEFSDVLLPIAPFTETSGSFVNAEGRLQSFHAVVRPLGETRPGWKVLRVLGNLLGLQGFDFETSQDVLGRATGAAVGSVSHVPQELLSNAVADGMPQSVQVVDVPAPAVASLYQLDGLVRRATSLQLTTDARLAREGVAA